MSEVSSLHVHPALVRTLQGVALWAVFSGLGACGSESENDDNLGRRVAQASTDSTETQIEGQSGTEYEPGGDHPGCPCGWLHNPLRGTVLEIVRHIEGTDGFPIRPGKVRLQVEELLGNTTGLEIGSEISGGWFGQLPCFYGCASFEVGDEVLAFYRPEEPCIGGADSCPYGDTIGAGFNGLTPWSDTLLLAQFVTGDLTLAVDDLPLLESPECQEQLGNWGDLVGPDDHEERCYEVAPRTP
jgi:hypothetical protein